MANPIIIDEVPTISMSDVADYIDEKEANKPKRGRPKGSKNTVEVVAGASEIRQREINRTLVATTKNAQALATRDVFDAAVKKYGCPITAMAEIGFNKKMPADIRLNALKEFAAYGHSKLKTVEHTGAGGEPLEFKMNIVQNILQLMKPEKDVISSD